MTPNNNEIFFKKYTYWDKQVLKMLEIDTTLSNLMSLMIYKSVLDPDSNQDVIYLNAVVGRAERITFVAKRWNAKELYAVVLNYSLEEARNADIPLTKLDSETASKIATKYYELVEQIEDAHGKSWEDIIQFSI